MARVTVEVSAPPVTAPPAAASARGCSEVVQCYVRDPPAAHVRRPQRLVGFARVELRPAERRKVHVELSAEALSTLDDGGLWRVVPGDYRLTCGTSSALDAHALTERIRIP